MRSRLVCRLLNADGRLLGWCLHDPDVLGDGYLRAAGPVLMYIEADGVAVTMSVHWVDVNVETRVPVPSTDVKTGQWLTVFEPKAPMLQAGNTPAQRLPPVTMRTHLSISTPIGSLGARSVA